MRPLLTSASVLVACVALAGCGGSDSPKRVASATPTATPKPKPRSVITVAQTHTIKLGVSEKQFASQFGPPPGPFRHVGKKLRCGYYDLPDKKPYQVQWKACFHKGKLNLFQTYVKSAVDLGPAGGGGAPPDVTIGKGAKGKS
jgi:hypothetical protein